MFLLNFLQRPIPSPPTPPPPSPALERSPSPSPEVYSVRHTIATSTKRQKSSTSGKRKKDPTDARGSQPFKKVKQVRTFVTMST